MARLRPTQWGTCVICNSGAILYEGDEGDVCEHCADLQELQKRLDEARAHVEALTRGGMAFDSLGHICCGKCGAAMWATEGMHYPDCSYVAARKWLEAQVQDDPVPDIHTDTDWCECSVCKAEAQDVCTNVEG